MDLPTFLVAFVAMLTSTVFFVGGKVVMARTAIGWVAYWRWSLLSAGVLGLTAWLILGAPAIPGWQWLLCAGLIGSMAHVFANTALNWGEASLLVPVSGAKPVVLLLIIPLLFGVAVDPGLTWACVLATVGVAVAGLAPRKRHTHARHPTLAFLIMIVATACMALSDAVGKVGLDACRDSPAHVRYGAIAIWNAGLGILPLLAFLLPAPDIPMAARRGAGMQGGIFALYIVLLAFAFQVAPDRAQAVPAVNVVISLRGVAAVILVMALDRWLGMGLEPVPRWVHAVRLVGAVILVAAVVLAF